MKKLCLYTLPLLFAVSFLPGQNSSAWNGAMWIWDSDNAKTQASSEPRFVRRTFEVPDKIVAADLFITCDNHYTAFINGQKVGEDSQWESVEKYNVAKLLVPGKNVLAIQAKNQGGVAGLIARVQIQTADKKDVVVGTDARTRVSLTPNKDWTKIDFDDAGWPTAVVLGDASMGPWNLAGGGAGKGGKPGKSYDTNAVAANIKGRISAEEQRKYFVVPEGFEVELVAADPLVINPITLTMDDKGRLYVSESHTYRYGPSGSPIKPFANPVVRLDPLPDGKGFKRTLIADGFADPVMGMAIRDNKLWLTANNFLYQYDLAEDGPATNKKTLAIDKNKAWNPFGMFVVEFGPDGQLYMSVGNHAIDIHGPDGKISGRGSSGVVLRMNPDASKMERLVHGLRVPYSFDYDPFGQLWLLSNGEGNPNRFVRVLDGVDYHCYSRPAVDNNWLAGNHPLAPPCIELHRGANTQLMRYYGAAYPEAYQGNLFLDNWGAHGFAGPNRGIFRFVPDEHGNIVHKEPLLSCTDPHFRPSHILLDQAGNLLVADWYGRDDESDMTGRIWRLKYVGKDKTPTVTHALDAAKWTKEETLTALGSPSHLVREKATQLLAATGDVDDLARVAATATTPLAAAHALWALAQSARPQAKAALAKGSENGDWKVRRLSINLLRRLQEPSAADVARKLVKDPDPAVGVEAALALPAKEIAPALVDILLAGAAADEHLRYEAAWHLAKNAELAGFTKLLFADDAKVRLAGLIALDVACYENFATKPVALAALSQALENPGKLEHDLLLTVAQLDGDGSIVPALEKMVSREDLPLASAARAILVLKAKAGGLKGVSAAAGKRLIEAVEKGTLKITPADQLVLFDFLEAEGPTPFALQQVGAQLRSNQPALRQAAHVLARKFGTKSAPLAESLWPTVLASNTKAEDAIELLAILARIEKEPRRESWEKLLTHPQPLVKTEAVRWWREFKGKQEMIDVLARSTKPLIKDNAGLKDDLATVFKQLNVKVADIEAAPDMDKEQFTKHAATAFTTMPPAERQQRALLGAQVFDRAGCTKCHTTATQTTPLAPSLKGIAAQKIDYLIESVLFPSKIIKTGFESVSVVTTDGKVTLGLVKEEGDFLRVLNLDRDVRIAKKDVEARTVSRVSIMPEGQEAQLSRREFVDLIAYLATLK